ncbi:hypothetical protein PALB_1340 [Pseudoalteromonas luteoviolacea B = ATCC 29581]|nr:hypothetical protein PALB_1340 [Pseudoalteromonas luteoviolacea B = ATCC 29581]
MNNLNPLIALVKAAPMEYIPKVGTQAHKLLTVLAVDGTAKRAELALDPLFGENLRSPLQKLEGDQFGHWLIHKVDGVLTLDPKHLSGDPELDAAARRERRSKLKDKSHKDAVNGRKREPKAFEESTEARKAYLKGLGKAANDSETEE